MALIALKHLTIGTAIWYADSGGARHAGDILERKDTLKSWGIIKVKVRPHRTQIPLWIDRKRIIEVCD